MNVPITRSAKGITLRLADIEIPSTTRPYNATAVKDLARSIKLIGLQSAPTVIEREGRHVLVAGRHRIEALKLLGHEEVFCRLVDMDDVEARLWTISENVHRAELTVGERSEQISEYAKLAEEKREAERLPAQVGPSVLPDGRRSGPQHEQRGDRLTARDLGMTRQEVQRAKAIAALPESTKEVARDLGLDDNQAAYLAAVRAEEPDEQVETLKEIAARGKVSTPRDPDARPLHNLVNLSAGKFCRWILLTTPNDQKHVLRLMEETTALYRDAIKGKDEANGRL